MAFSKIHEKSSTCPCTMWFWNGQNETSHLHVGSPWTGGDRNELYQIWSLCNLAPMIALTGNLLNFCVPATAAHPVLLHSTILHCDHPPHEHRLRTSCPTGAACSVQAEHFICWLRLACIKAARSGPLKRARLIQLQNFILIFKTCRCCNLYIWE